MPETAVRTLEAAVERHMACKALTAELERGAVDGRTLQQRYGHGARG